MEHSTSAVNWQPVNLAKKPGELARDSLTARRARRRRRLLLPVAAVGGRRREVPLGDGPARRRRTARSSARSPTSGATLADLAPVAGHARASRPASAILFDWESWWASELDSHPTARLRYRQEALDWYSAFLALGVRADVVTPPADLDRYDLLVAPILHVVPADAAPSG